VSQNKVEVLNWENIYYARSVSQNKGEVLKGVYIYKEWESKNI